MYNPTLIGGYMTSYRGSITVALKSPHFSSMRYQEKEILMSEFITGIDEAIFLNTQNHTQKVLCRF